MKCGARQTRCAWIFLIHLLAGSEWSVAIGQPQPKAYDFATNGIQQARIASDNRTPRLLINEQAVPPLLFWAQVQVPERLAALNPQVRLASANGVHIYKFEYLIPWTGNYYAYYDAAMDAFIAADPSAVFLLQIKEEVYDQDHTLVFGPNEDNVYQDGTRSPISVASDTYFNAYKAAIQRFITHYEGSSYSKRILGYHIGGGENLEEWFPRDYRSKGLDYSVVNTNAFRSWLRLQYETDANLSQAWGRTVTLNGATIPLPQPGRFPLHSAFAGERVEAFYRLPDEQDWVDYSTYISDITATRILDLAALVKSLTQRKRLVSFYYGYIFQLPGSMSGHLRMDRLLKSPDIDILAAPISYINETDRLAGGAAGAMTALDSVAAHGKLWMNEDDLRTHIAAASGILDIGYNGSHPTANFAETYNVLLRNLASVLIHRGATYWMDLNGVAAFNDPRLWKIVSEIGLPSFDQTYANPRPYRPEVAVVVDQRSVTYEKNDFDLMLLGRAFLSNAIAATGATVGYYYLDDFLDGTLPPAKIYLFANTTYLSDAQISAIQARLAAEGSTAIWQYAPGYLGPGGPDVERVSRLTGLTIQRVDGVLGSAGLGTMSGHSWGWAGSTISPRLVVKDAAAESLGHYSADRLVSSARKKVGNFQTIFLGDVGMTTDMLREILRQSGAHIWTDNGEIVHTDGNFVVVHRKDAGSTRIHAPFGVSVTPMTGNVDLVDADGVVATFVQYETRFFSLTALPVPVIEYHHAAFDHYFITPKPDEIAILDARTPPFQEWSRTGFTFNAWASNTAPAGSTAICRFFNDHFAPKSSHFYAAHGFGCETTITFFPDWSLENSTSFNTLLPDAAGNCSGGTIPVYRLYNNGMGAAPNHRFVTSLAERQNMVNRGYVPEGNGIGVGMCVPR